MAKQPQKRQVFESVSLDWIDDLQSVEIDQAIAYLNNLKAVHGFAGTDLLTYANDRYEGPYDVGVTKVRDETDEELDARLKLERKAKAQAARRKKAVAKTLADKDYATYLRLKKQFEGNAAKA